MERQFTATVYIIDEGKVLLIHHRKLQKWLPPGGHLDPNELPSDGAKREALEETGYEIELYKDENVWIKRPNAKSFERPYLCLLEEIPAYGGRPVHQHIDMIYLARPVSGTKTHNAVETNDIRWFSLEEVEGLESDVEIFLETKEVIRKVLSSSLIG
jgi:8-oxo-dGTP pyrophosphatase MutT (NUDIX family)